jgi:hypothetical protein
MLNLFKQRNSSFWVIFNLKDKSKISLNLKLARVIRLNLCLPRI